MKMGRILPIEIEIAKNSHNQLVAQKFHGIRFEYNSKNFCMRIEKYFVHKKYVYGALSTKSTQSFAFFVQQQQHDKILPFLFLFLSTNTFHSFLSSIPLCYHNRCYVKCLMQPTTRFCVLLIFCLERFPHKFLAILICGKRIPDAGD